MRRYGFGNYGALTGDWHSTLATIRSIVPSWFGPSTVTIDVSDSRSAPEELRAALAEVPDDAQVILSARAQKALIATFGNEQGELDRVFAESTVLPPDVGEMIRGVVLARQKALDGRIAQFIAAQKAAYAAGVPEAEMDEEEAARLYGWMIVAGVGIVAAVAGLCYLFKVAMQEEQETLLVGSALDEAIAAAKASGDWSMIPQILGTAVKPPKEFPWGYVVGGTVLVALGIGGFFFLGEYAKERGKALGARK